MMRRIVFWVKFITVTVISAIAVVEILSNNNTYATPRKEERDNI